MTPKQYAHAAWIRRLERRRALKMSRLLWAAQYDMDHGVHPHEMARLVAHHLGMAGTQADIRRVQAALLRALRDMTKS